LGLKPSVQGKFFGSVNLGCAGGGEQLRDLLGVEVFLHGGVRRRADDLEGQQHFVALDQLAHLLDRFRRAISIVVTGSS